ncbi:MAG: 50S ribosomal protein L30 [Caldilineae bacterium]|nr:MAG: 50S ribosomal protein L30 [Caldilineae bacterium]
MSKKKSKAQKNKLIITYRKSVIGYDQRQRGTIRALGLSRLGDVVEHEDTPVIRGMIAKVRHLVTVEERPS